MGTPTTMTSVLSPAENPVTMTLKLAMASGNPSRM
jgi:hypothetical protein